MDGQYSTAAIDELMSVVRKVQEQAKTQAKMPLVVRVHFAFAGLACAAFAVSVLAKVAGLSTGDEYTDKFGFSCITSVMFFAVGSLMIERKRGELAGGAIGRALVACGLWVMSAQSYEFMQKAKSCEIQHDLLAKRKATPVSQFVSLQEYEFRTPKSCVKWSKENDRRPGPVSVVYRRTGFTVDATGRSVGGNPVQHGTIIGLPGGAPDRPASTDGSQSF